MEGTEIALLMLITCIRGTLLYSRESPLNNLGLSRTFKSLLMGIGVAITAFLIITSPFGRRPGAHVNPAVTVTSSGWGETDRGSVMANPPDPRMRFRRQ